MCSKHGKAMTLTFQQVEQWLDEHYDLAEDYFVRKATARMVKLWQEATRVRCEREKSNPGIEESTISSGIGDKESALKAKQCHFNNSVEIFNSNEYEDECGEARPHRRLSEPHRQPTTQRQFSVDERKRQLLYSKSIPSTFFQSLDLNLSTLSELKEDKIKRVKSPPRQLRKTKSLPNCGQQHVLGSLIESKVRLPSSKSLNKESKLDLKNNNEREFFFEIVRDIANDLDLKTLSYKILVNVGILTNADRCSLFIVEGPKGKQWLVSKVFDVHIGSTNSPAPKEAIDHQREIRVPFGVGLVGYAAATGETVNIPDAYADPRFNQEVDKQTGYHTKSLLCKPVKNNEGEVVGVAQIINKNPGGVPFTKEDEKVCDMYLTFCGIGITNAKLFELSAIEFNRNRALLELVHDIFEEQTSLEKVVHKIMKRALGLLKCEKCSVLLLSQPVLGNSSAEHRAQELRFSSVFNLKTMTAKNTSSTTYSEGHDDRSFTSRIAKFVSAIGKTIIIPDALQDSRVRKILAESSDGDKKDFSSIMCMPIRNNKFEIIGVAEVINRLDNKPFDENDENLFEAFAIFCGLGIHNTMIYDQMARAKAKQQVAIEVLSYHVAAKKSEVEKIVTSRVPTSEELNLFSFTFDDFSLSADEMLMASIRMFRDSGFIEAFHIDYETLGRWLLTVKNNYRNVIYHNWRHAFNVAQSMFCMLETGNMKSYLTKLECLGLIVGCLCHDLDHRGTNNAFQAKTDTPLSKLYGTSTMEHHHFNHAVIILSTERVLKSNMGILAFGNWKTTKWEWKNVFPEEVWDFDAGKRGGHNIFQGLSADEYRQVISYIKHSILSTDLATNFKQRPKFFPLVENGLFDSHNMDHIDMLKAMMMTACDLNGTTKPWEIQTGVVNLVTREFFEQGDLERERLNVEPLAIMDRKKIDELPKLQVGFFETTGIPVFKVLSQINSKLKPLAEGAEANKRRWKEIDMSREKYS